MLLLEAMKRALDISEAAGVVGLFVDAKDQAAADFYRKFGFVPNADDKFVLFMPLATIAKAFA